MYGKTRWDEIWNKNIRESCKEENMIKNSLSKKNITSGDSQITRVRGKPKKIIREIIKKVLMINKLYQNIFYDRTLWHILSGLKYKKIFLF